MPGKHHKILVRSARCVADMSLVTAEGVERKCIAYASLRRNLLPWRTAAGAQQALRSSSCSCLRRASSRSSTAIGVHSAAGVSLGAGYDLSSSVFSTRGSYSFCNGRLPKALAFGRFANLTKTVAGAMHDAPNLTVAAATACVSQCTDAGSNQLDQQGQQQQQQQQQALLLLKQQLLNASSNELNQMPADGGGSNGSDGNQQCRDIEETAYANDGRTIVLAAVLGKTVDCSVIGRGSGFDVQDDVVAQTKLGKLRQLSVNASEFDAAVDNCEAIILQAIRSRLPGGTSSVCPGAWRKRDSLFSFVMEGIYPGTKWCGPGNIARGPDDLGRLRDLDACCRTHDSCPQSISCCGGSSNGLVNYSLFTRSACWCDYEFHACLRRVDTWHARLIAFAFFESGAETCYEFDHPFTCRRRVYGFCKKWRRNMREPKRWQWGKYQLDKWRKH